MKHSQWGLCKRCKWWQIEPGARVKNATMGLCIDDKLQPFILRVSGNSGCNRYMKGTAARAPGSAGTPPPQSPSVDSSEKGQIGSSRNRKKWMSLIGYDSRNPI
jgi:hypothetical protein